MDLKQAIESGKRFKRRHWLEWTSHTHTSSYGAEQVTSDDWVVEEPAKQKVTMWQCVYVDVSSQVSISSRLFKNEADAKTYCGCDDFIKLVNPIEIEI